MHSFCLESKYKVVDLQLVGKTQTPVPEAAGLEDE